jgi:hypothetical protein
VRLSRERILESAAHVFGTHAESPSLLEFEFANEVRAPQLFLMND